MTPTPPPYSLTAPSFPFRALATLAGRAPTGPEREVVLGCYMAARLAAGALPRLRFGLDGRAARAAAARGWFAALALPATTRIPFARLVDATAGGSTEEVAGALATVGEVTARALDDGARAELDQLIQALRQE
jgi:hypothetical protein